MLFRMVYLKFESDMFKILKTKVFQKPIGLLEFSNFRSLLKFGFLSKVAHHDEKNFLFQMVYHTNIFVPLERSWSALNASVPIIFCLENLKVFTKISAKIRNNVVES